MLFLLCYNLKIVIQWGEGVKIWWGGGCLLEGGIFLGGGMSKFLAVGGDSLHPPSAENPDPDNQCLTNI